MSDPASPELVVTAARPLPPLPEREVRIYEPQISVVLKKAINRRTLADGVDAAQRLQGADSVQIDLAPFLGEGSGVQVRRSVRGPDSGMFSIRIPDQMLPGQGESIYGLVEPMDVIEIGMARVATSIADSAGLPIVLRGFVTEISRSEVMTPAGPQRTVIITGHDYSKILQIMRVIYLPTMIVGQDLLTSFSLFLNYDVNAQSYDTADQFVREVMDKVIGQFIARMQASTGGGNSPVLAFKVEATSPKQTSNVSPYGTQGWGGGTIYDLLAQFGDVGPWQELYVEDRDDGPYLVYRPVPLKGVVGGYVQPEADTLPTAVATILVEGADVIALNVTRTDSDVANYFWVDAPSYQLIGSPQMQQDQNLDPPPRLDGYQNCDPQIFGIRLLSTATSQGGRYDGQPAAAMDQGDANAMLLSNEKRRILIDSNKDNVVFERGEMRLKGDPALRAGNYFKLRRGGFLASYYGHTVTHDFIIGQAYTTTVEFDRGTGFIERSTREGVASAYLAEIGGGAT